MRTCSLCERDLPTTEFYADKRGKDGLTRRCKDCHTKKSYESRLRKIDTLSKHERYEYHRARHLQKTYGITVEQYDEMLLAQGGVCLICKEPERIRQGMLAVDHDHATGAIRGLLCSDCNTGLGKFKDNPHLLQAAIEYLKNSCCEGAPL